MPFGNWLSTCDCGQQIDGDGFHLLTCKWGGGPVWEHDTIVPCWSDCHQELGIHHRKEPRDRYMNSNNRPDIVVYNTEQGTTTDLDVSLAHPWCSEIVKRCGNEQDSLRAEERQRRKRNTQENAQREQTAQPSTPLLHFGCWGEEAISYLRSLAK